MLTGIRVVRKRPPPRPVFEEPQPPPEEVPAEPEAPKDEAPPPDMRGDLDDVPADLRVGDGGKGWRRRQEKRLNEDPVSEEEAPDYTEIGIWGGRKGGRPSKKDRESWKKIIKKNRKKDSNNSSDEEDFQGMLRDARTGKSGDQRYADKIVRKRNPNAPLADKSGNCIFCPHHKDFETGIGRAMIALSKEAYILYQVPKEAVVQDQLMIAALHHVPACTEAEEEVMEDIRTFQKQMVRIFAKDGRVPIFVECLTSVPSPELVAVGGGPHLLIEVIPILKEHVDEVKGKFKIAFMEGTVDWKRENVKIVETVGLRGPCGAIPKRMPYLHVNFGHEDGYSHVVETGREFDRHMARRIVEDTTDRNILDTKVYTNDESWVSSFKVFSQKYRSLIEE